MQDLKLVIKPHARVALAFFCNGTIGSIVAAHVLGNSLPELVACRHPLVLLCRVVVTVTKAIVGIRGTHGFGAVLDVSFAV